MARGSIDRSGAGAGLSRRRVLLYGAGVAVAGIGGTTAWQAWADAVDDEREDRRARAAGVQAALDARTVAIRARDARALAATLAPSAPADLVRRQHELLANLAQVPLAQWSYRVLSLDAYPLPPALEAGGGAGERAAVAAELDYRLAGFDEQAMTATQYLTFERGGDGTWRLAADRDHDGGDVLLWDLGPVRVVRGRYSLVLGLRDQASLAALGAEADQAVPAVSGVWGGGWGQRTVLLAPQTADQFGTLLGADPSAFAGIAAVCTGELGAADGRRTDRITVNPDAWDGLSALGRRVVITHETTHVATRTLTESWTPRWLSEGVADWTGYLGTGRTPAQTTPELAAALTAAGPGAARLLASLPRDSAFDGGAPGTALQQAYQKAWFACRTVVDRYGQAKLVALYAAVAAEGAAGKLGQDAVVDRALRRTLGVGTDTFTAQWRSDVLSALGAAAR
ncbi:hypothetical protein [Streptacidiphilus jiangxiensis]|uniref:Peptidase MA superfamily protein n=1 Tax=Streptacidiphilus jiangxiensis TaxID=235985 RepID=A0A1H7SRT3_STRJI|nr:hypothetical protein [Streptacidiphilus jiangxiensis]SEL75281.1 hypothetical protein SAMN05414137_112185 [Streptacidiphilus jiangxiensis]